MTRQSALDHLRAQVLGTPLCTACGACVSYCPYVVAREDRVASVASCDKVEGRCFRNCPRSDAVVGGSLAGDAGYRGPLGEFTAAVMARARSGVPSGSDEAGPGAQHGGTVTALMAHAFRNGLIDAAVLTRWIDSDSAGIASNGCLPETFLATSPEEVLAASGSKFAVAPTLAVVNQAIKQGYRRLGVVALPCQATALRKMLLTETPEAPAGIALIVGLFCTWALTQRGWAGLLARYVGDGPVRKVDIPPPPAQIMEVEVRGGRRVDIPLDEVRATVRDACRVCLDMTSENADLSVGLVEGIEGWNTVLVRTETGRTLLESALAAGVLEVDALENERLLHLTGASLGKKRRAIAAAENYPADMPYLTRICAYKEEVEHDALTS